MSDANNVTADKIHGILANQSQLCLEMHPEASIFHANPQMTENTMKLLKLLKILKQKKRQ